MKKTEVYIRPRVKELYLWKIRNAYPRETATINGLEKIIEFAIQKGLEYAVHMKYCELNTTEVINKK